MVDLELGLGVVVDFGGIIGDAGTDHESVGDLADGMTSVAVIGGGLAGFATKSAKAVEDAKADSIEAGWWNSVAFYIGPILRIGFLYVTAGACLGGFGCFAVGGGIALGSLRVGVLIPLSKWW